MGAGAAARAAVGADAAGGSGEGAAVEEKKDSTSETVSTAGAVIDLEFLKNSGFFVCFVSFEALYSSFASP